MSVTRINSFQARDGAADDLHALLTSIVPLIKQSEGCESCQVLRNLENSNAFVVIEVWISVDAHQASAKNIPPEKIAKVMPVLSRIRAMRHAAA